MLKLFFASSALIPVIFLSLNVQAESNGSSLRKESLSYNTSIELTIEEMSNCQSGEIPVYFHDQFITQHSAELINTASDVTNNCEIEALNVVVYNNDETLEMMKEREAEIKSYIQATGLRGPIYAKIEQGDRDSLWLNGRRAVIEIELNQKTDLVATS
ncbi:hypothetical protein [Litorimonas haliclonae]|uniref:hypothetical protein n=1 Tax=Litorimonas haliclonae TaxID=2081977 RepID=UPI0039F072DC